MDFPGRETLHTWYVNMNSALAELKLKRQSNTVTHRNTSFNRTCIFASDQSLFNAEIRGIVLETAGFQINRLYKPYKSVETELMTFNIPTVAILIMDCVTTPRYQLITISFTNNRKFQNFRFLLIFQTLTLQTRPVNEVSRAWGFAHIIFMHAFLHPYAPGIVAQLESHFLASCSKLLCEHYWTCSKTFKYKRCMGRGGACITSRPSLATPMQVDRTLPAPRPNGHKTF